MGARKFINAIFRTAAENEIERLMRECGEMVKKVERFNRKRIMTPPEREEIGKIKKQYEQAQKGAEMAYRKTRAELMKKYLAEEIDVYEGRHPSGPQIDERAAEGGTQGVAPSAA